MTRDEVKSRLSKSGFTIREEKRLANDTGFQIRLEGGAIVNVFDKGTVSVQGKPGEKEKVELAVTGNVTQAPSVNTAGSNRVFVVYGHDTNARTQCCFGKSA